jgi:putative ABC transport system permease protein
VNAIVLHEGRLPDPARAHEIVINEAFAERNALGPGDELAAVLYGRRRVLAIVGVASSPEFVFAVAPGEITPEPQRFGVFWMGREGLARAYDLDGAFNDVVIRLARDAEPREVMAAVDGVLARHGGRGAYGRDRMISAQFLEDELDGLQTMASVLPPIFLGVAVFLVNVSLSRLIATERANIGLLKSFGYTNAAVAVHYAKFSLAFAALGTVLGVTVGQVGGDYMAEIYRSVYRLPDLAFEAGPLVYLGAVGVGLAAAVLGSAQAVLRAIRLPPAAALAPPAPTGFGGLGASVENAARRLDAKSRMIVRRIVRFPRRALSTVAGMAAAIALLVTSQHFPIAMNHIVDVNFGSQQRMDVTLAFADTFDAAILRDVRELPGVLVVEPMRAAPVLLTAGPHSQRDTILGIPDGARLNRVLDSDEQPVPPRPDGLTLAETLADKLGVQVGDVVRVQATEGRRRSADVPVVAVVDPFVGAPAYMELDALNRLLQEPERVTAAYLLVDGAASAAFNREVKELPAIAGVTYADNSEATLRKLFSEGSGFFAALFVLFASLMAAGVAFSAARVTLAEQERDLATLRVLGFRRGEASYVLLGELGALLLAAIPFGIVLGYLMTRWLFSQFETELFQFPHVVSPGAYGESVLFVVVAVVGASLAVRRGVDRLDLVGVLKSRE